MCVNYIATPRKVLETHFGLYPPPDAPDWPDSVWQDYQAPVIVDRGEGPHVLVGTYGMIPQRRNPPGVRLTTLNARAETVGEKRSYKSAWQRSQLCLVPLLGFVEPCYESGKAERYRIGMADGTPFAVAGLVREWAEPEGGVSFSFTQLTINADDHPLMKRMHKPGDEKRSLVIIPSADYASWLTCRDPEIARTFLQLYPADLMAAHNEGSYGRHG